MKNLAIIHLGIEIQKGPHDSVEDARAAMELYKLVEDSYNINTKFILKPNKSIAESVNKLHSNQ